MIQSIPIDIQGEFGYTSIKFIAETGTKVRLLTNSSIRETYFLHETNNNLILNDVPNYRPSSESLPQLGYSMVINGKEVQAEKLNENIFSDDALMISDIQRDFDSLWAAGQIEKQKINHTQAGKALDEKQIRADLICHTLFYPQNISTIFNTTVYTSIIIE